MHHLPNLVPIDVVTNELKQRSTLSKNRSTGSIRKYVASTLLLVWTRGFRRKATSGRQHLPNNISLPVISFRSYRTPMLLYLPVPCFPMSEIALCQFVNEDRTRRSHTISFRRRT